MTVWIVQYVMDDGYSVVYGVYNQPPDLGELAEEASLMGVDFERAWLEGPDEYVVQDKIGE